MKRIDCTALVAVFLATASFAGEYRAKVRRVLDGDTIEVKFLGAVPPPNLESPSTPTSNIRLRFSDAPETRKGPNKPGQPFGKLAKEFTEAMLPVGTEIRFVTEDGNERGFFNRPLGLVFNGGTNVNRALIDEGLAHVFPFPTLRVIKCQNYELFIPYVGAELFARNAGKGIWRKDSGLKESPHNYRRRMRGKQPTNVTLRQYSDAVRRRVERMKRTCGD